MLHAANQAVMLRVVAASSVYIDNKIVNNAFVHILASKRNGTLYTGVTNDIVRRMCEHKGKISSNSFTAKYNVDKLVWFTARTDITAAIELEKKIKNRSRTWKLALIEKENPDWNDLGLNFLDSATYARNDEAGS